jgi:hypothetical protein
MSGSRGRKRNLADRKKWHTGGWFGTMSTEVYLEPKLRYGGIGNKVKKYIRTRLRNIAKFTLNFL